MLIPIWTTQNQLAEFFFVWDVNCDRVYQLSKLSVYGHRQINKSPQNKLCHNALSGHISSFPQGYLNLVFVLVVRRSLNLPTYLLFCLYLAHFSNPGECWSSALKSNDKQTEGLRNLLSSKLLGPSQEAASFWLYSISIELIMLLFTLTSHRFWLTPQRLIVPCSVKFRLTPLSFQPGWLPIRALLWTSIRQFGLVTRWYSPQRVIPDELLGNSILFQNRVFGLGSKKSNSLQRVFSVQPYLLGDYNYRQALFGFKNSNSYCQSKQNGKCQISSNFNWPNIPVTTSVERML